MIRDQEKLAIAQLPKAARIIQEYRQQLEKDYGFPIVFKQLETQSLAGGIVRPYWDQRREVRCHSIDLSPCDVWARPHKFSHELTHIALECEAQASGQRKSHDPLAPTMHRLLAACDPKRSDEEYLLRRLYSYSMNVPVDLVVESRLARDFPVLAPAQFVNLHRFEERNARGHKHSLIWNVSPETRLAYDALVATRARFVDELVPGPFKYYERFRGTDAGSLADQLHAEFQTAFQRGMAPGDHYILVDRFAAIIGLPGIHGWRPEPVFEIVEQLGLCGIS